MVKQIEDTQLTVLDKFLCTKYAFSSSKYVCEYCEFIAKNQQAMSAHKRGCKLKNTALTDTEVITESNIIIEIPENKKSKTKK
jgi:hypothetical protein